MSAALILSITTRGLSPVRFYPARQGSVCFVSVRVEPGVATALHGNAGNLVRLLRHAPEFAVVVRIISAIAVAAAAGEAIASLRVMRLCCCLRAVVLPGCAWEHGVVSGLRCRDGCMRHPGNCTDVCNAVCLGCGD